MKGGQGQENSCQAGRKGIDPGFFKNGHCEGCLRQSTTSKRRSGWRTTLALSWEKEKGEVADSPTCVGWQGSPTSSVWLEQSLGTLLDGCWNRWVNVVASVLKVIKSVPDRLQILSDSPSPSSPPKKISYRGSTLTYQRWKIPFIFLSSFVQSTNGYRSSDVVSALISHDGNL